MVQLICMLEFSAQAGKLSQVAVLLVEHFQSKRAV